MARPTKQGLDYFPFDVGFFGDDDRIRNLKLRYHANGLIVYVRILCDVYKEGYYLPVKRWDDYVLGLADEFKMSVNAVEQVIAFLRTRALLRIFRKGKDDLSGFDGDAVITSHGIQLRYAEAVKDNRKRSVEEVRRDFWLLTEEEEAKIFTSNKSRNNENKSTINTDKSTINSTKESKGKEIKVNESKVNQVVTINPTKSNNIDNCTDIRKANEGLSSSSGMRSTEEQRQHELAKRKLFQMCPKLEKSSRGVDDTPIESYVKLLDAFNRSMFLQGWNSFKWIVENYHAIVEGAYDDYNKETTSSVSKSASTPPTLPPAVLEANAIAERKRFYELRQNESKKEASKRLEKALKLSVEFASATDELVKMQVHLGKAEFNNDTELLQELKAKESALFRARAYGLKKIGMTVEDLEVKPFCKKCKDTGFLPNGLACDCYQKEKEKEK